MPGTLEESETLMQKIMETPEVTGATPFLYTEVMLSAPGGVKGLVLRGINPDTASDVLSILKDMTAGSVQDLRTSVPEGEIPGIIIGGELAKRLGLSVGSRVNLLTASGQKTATGFAPRVRPFEVVGIFKTGMFEYDSSLGFVALPAAREVLGLPEKRISGVELTVKDVYTADKVAEAVSKSLGRPYYVRHWMEMNANLFAALKLE